MTTPYGVSGCICWARGAVTEEGWADGGPTWQENPSCQYHGTLPRERMDTGVYRVYTGPCERHRGASTIAGLCAMCSRRPSDLLTTFESLGPEGLATRRDVCETPMTHNWGCACRCGESGCDGTHIPNGEGELVCTPEPVLAAREADGGQGGYGSRCCPGTTTEKERGVLATVRRWARTIRDVLRDSNGAGPG